MHKLIDEFHEARRHSFDELARVSILRDEERQAQVGRLIDADLATFLLALGIDRRHGIHDEVPDKLGRQRPLAGRRVIVAQQRSELGRIQTVARRH